MDTAANQGELLEGLGVADLLLDLGLGLGTLDGRGLGSSLVLGIGIGLGLSGQSRGDAGAQRLDAHLA